MTDADSTPPRRFPPVAVALTGVLGVGVGIGVGALVWAGGGSPSSSGAGATAASQTTTTKPAALTGQAKQLERLLTAGDQVTYHATYSLTSSDPSTAGTIAVEIWRMPPLERQDSSLESSGTAEHQEALQLTTGLVTCQQSGAGAWACSSQGNTLPSGPDAIIQGITSSLSGATVTSAPATVSGVSGTRYTVTEGGTTLSVSVSSKGIPLEVTDGTDTLQLTALDNNVTKSDFTPPAPVSSSSTSTTTAS
ncbi:MAG TPA: hypothetical protein VGF87_06130 [Acidimicrobiales bacterium]